MLISSSGWVTVLSVTMKSKDFHIFRSRHLSAPESSWKAISSFHKSAFWGFSWTKRVRESFCAFSSLTLLTKSSLWKVHANHQSDSYRSSACVLFNVLHLLWKGLVILHKQWLATVLPNLSGQPDCVGWFCRICHLHPKYQHLPEAAAHRHGAFAPQVALAWPHYQEPLLWTVPLY